jgi:hypothetical protein
MTSAKEVTSVLKDLQDEIGGSSFHEGIVQETSDTYEVATFEQLVQAINTVLKFVNAYETVEEEHDEQRAVERDNQRVE